MPEYTGLNPYARDRRVTNTFDAGGDGEEYSPIIVSEESFTILLELQRSELAGNIEPTSLPLEILKIAKMLANASNINITDNPDTDEYLILSWETRRGRSMSICLYGS
jgi:hypothetical protein